MMTEYKTKPQYDNHSVGAYLSDIRGINLITMNDEIVLAKRIKAGDHRALAELVKANLRFVVSIAKTYQNQGLPLNDLINEGNLGLIQAALRFDETRGYKFISYAVWWIRQGILQALQENSRMIRLPGNKIGVLSKMNKIKSRLEQQLERQPTNDELSEELDIDAQQCETIAECNRQIVSLDDAVSKRSDLHIIDFIEDPESINPEDEIASETLNGDIQEALDSLSQKESTILKLYFGIGSGRPQTLEDIAKRFHLTKERVRQIKERSLTKLRHKSRSKNLRVYIQ